MNRNKVGKIWTEFAYLGIRTSARLLWTM